MQQTRTFPLPIPEPPYAPTEDDLITDDGDKMESWRHVLQMYLLITTLLRAWHDRDDVFVGGNMFVYYSPDQLMTEDFRGPDVFVATGVERHPRKAWLVWRERKGPDVVIELLSDSTARRDRTEKKLVYQDRLRVPEYFLFDPWTGEAEGYMLDNGVYVPIAPDADGGLPCRVLGLKLMPWEGVHRKEPAVWLRWATEDGVLLPTEEEAADQAEAEAERERAHAERERLHAEQERARADEAQRRVSELEARLARYEQQNGPGGPADSSA